MTLGDIHGQLAITALLFSSGMIVWGFWRYFKRMDVSSSYFGAVVIAEIIYLAQALLGLFLFISGTGELERPPVHILYGAVLLLTLPGVYIYTRGDESRRTMLLYSLAFIFLIGITFRSMSTGG